MIRKRLLWILAFVVIVSVGLSFSSVAVADPVYAKGDAGFIFSIVPGTEQWKTLETTQEMIEAYQIPQGELQQLSTSALVNTILEEFFLRQFMVFDTTEKALELFKESFNIYPELYSREDVLPVLTEAYESCELEEHHSFDDAMKAYTLEILLMDQFASNNNLSAESRQLHFERFLEKYRELKEE